MPCGQESEQDTRNLLTLARASSKDTDNNSERTIVHEIVDSKLPASEKTFERITNDVGTINGAEFETTASVLRLIFYHVWSNPETLQRLRAEIASVMPPTLAPSDYHKLEIKTLERLPYLTSVIMEGMRLSPAIGHRMARIAPDRDLFYGDGKMRIPAGTPVGMTTILMHTDETLYPAPLSFRPDRWMSYEDRKRLDKTYAPFSKGTRICLGMHLAWAEMYLIIAQTVQRFDFEFVDRNATHFQMESDQFIIGTKGNAELKTIPFLYKGYCDKEA